MYRHDGRIKVDEREADDVLLEAIRTCNGDTQCTDTQLNHAKIDLQLTHAHAFVCTYTYTHVLYIYIYIHAAAARMNDMRGMDALIKPLNP